eukprot:jgi/Ulvmu1/2022/UM120_0018.1
MCNYIAMLKDMALLGLLKCGRKVQVIALSSRMVSIGLAARTNEVAAASVMQRMWARATNLAALHWQTLHCNKAPWSSTSQTTCSTEARAERADKTGGWSTSRHAESKHANSTLMQFAHKSFKIPDCVHGRNVTGATCLRTGAVTATHVYADSTCMRQQCPGAAHAAATVLS